MIDLQQPFDLVLPRVLATLASEEPTCLASSFIHGIKQLPVAWTPTG